MSFLENTHPHYDAKSGRWQTAWSHYTGEYASPENIAQHLHRKEQAETDRVFAERKNTSDPQLLFPTAVDSLNGILFAKSDQTEREWGELGDPEQAGSIAHKLSHNADGSGTNWLPLMKKVAIYQTVVHRVWGLVDGVGPDGGEASVNLINPASVVNWYPSGSMPRQVLVKEQQDQRSSIRDTEGEADAETYVLYEAEGWTRYRLDDGAAEVIGEGEYDFYADQSRSERILPIFPIEIPMPRDVGYFLARKQNHIFNFKSIRDSSVRNMSFAFLQLVADSEQYNDMMAEIKKGFRVLRKDPDASGEHGYKSPDSSYLGEAGNILEKDKTDFMESAFSTYGDAAKQVTATEIRQESRSGVEAFLTLLVSSVDEFENKCFKLLEQVYFPDNPAAWGQAFVKRSDNFQPEDSNEVLDQMSNVIRNASTANAMSTYRKVQKLNPEFSEDEIEEEVKKINEERGAIEIPNDMMGG